MLKKSIVLSVGLLATLLSGIGLCITPQQEEDVNSLIRMKPFTLKTAEVYQKLNPSQTWVQVGLKKVESIRDNPLLSNECKDLCETGHSVALLARILRDPHFSLFSVNTQYVIGVQETPAEESIVKPVSRNVKRFHSKRAEKGNALRAKKREAGVRRLTRGRSN